MLAPPGPVLKTKAAHMVTARAAIFAVVSVVIEAADSGDTRSSSRESARNCYKSGATQPLIKGEHEYLRR